LRGENGKRFSTQLKEKSAKPEENLLHTNNFIQSYLESQNNLLKTE